MIVRNFTLMFFSMLFIFACNVKEEPAKETATPTFTLENKLDLMRKDVLVQFDPNLLEMNGESSLSNLTTSDGTACQLNDLDGDGKTDQVSVLLNFKSGEKKSLSFKQKDSADETKKVKQRTQAEISHKINGEWKDREYIGGTFQNVDYLKAPPEHTDHSWFIRYEGPGIESDLVGYRFYLDWRNAVDIFGKKTHDMVLQKVGLDGFDSYHEPSDWGMDVLKVGPSLGLASIGYWDGEKAIRVEKTDSLDARIVLNGPIESMVRTGYYGWEIDSQKTDLISELSMHGGSRLVTQKLEMTSPLKNICTGIVKHEEAELLEGGTGDHRYLATWGKQSLAEDLLGMAVFYRANNATTVTEDENSDIVVLKPEGNVVQYYFLATWEQGVEGITSKEDFIKLLEKTLLELDNPISLAAN